MLSTNIHNGCVRLHNQGITQEDLRLVLGAYIVMLSPGLSNFKMYNRHQVATNLLMASASLNSVGNSQKKSLILGSKSDQSEEEEDGGESKDES